MHLRQLDSPETQNSRVAVIGGGPAGCAAALALSRAGVEDVVVIEAGRHQRPRVGESLPPDARPLLQELGVWEAFRAQGHAPCLGNCSAWGGDELGYSDYVLLAQGPGGHLDRRRFDAWLCEQARACGARLLYETRLTGATRSAGGFRLDLRNASGETQLEARHVIDASGFHGRFARSQGAQRVWLDRLFFVYGYFLPPPAAAPSRLTLVESIPEGWWYRAGLPNGRLCIALACEAETLRARRLDRWRPWLNLLAESRHAARDLAGGRFLKDEMQTMPAPTFHLDTATGEGWLAAGDAAGAFDPILARGIHKALEDGLHAGRTVARWLDQRHTDEAAGYRNLLAGRFAQMRVLRAHFYALETRWPKAPFWRRRMGADEEASPLPPRTASSNQPSNGATLPVSGFQGSVASSRLAATPWAAFGASE